MIVLDQLFPRGVEGREAFQEGERKYTHPGFHDNAERAIPVKRVSKCRIGAGVSSLIPVLEGVEYSGFFLASSVAYIELTKLGGSGRRLTL